MLIKTIALQNAKNSTAIENIFTTEDELYKAVSDSIKESNANPGTKEVFRYREALWRSYDQLKEKDNINLESIISIFQQIKSSSSGLRAPQSLTVIQRDQSEFRAGGSSLYPTEG